MQTTSDQRARVSWTFTCVLMQCVSMELIHVHGAYVRPLVHECEWMCTSHGDVLCPCSVCICAHAHACHVCFSMSNASMPHALMPLAQHVAHARAQVYTHVAAVQYVLPLYRRAMREAPLPPSAAPMPLAHTISNLNCNSVDATCTYVPFPGHNDCVWVCAVIFWW